VPQQRLETIAAAADAHIVLTPDQVANLDDALRPPVTIGPSDPYYIMFTSGSTGEPKGVVITLGCLTAFVDWLVGEQRFGEGEVFLNQAPYSFDLSVMDTYAALTTGGTVYSLTNDRIESPRLLYAALRASGVTTWVSTPSFAAMCVAE